MYKKNKLEPLLFLLPATTLVLFIFLVPFLYSIVISLTDWNGITRDLHFVGLANYIELFKDSTLYDTIGNNIVYFLEIVTIQNILGVFFAALLREKFRGRDFFRAAMFLPTVICTVAVGFVWNLLLDPVCGYIPAFLSKIGAEQLASIIWLGDVRTAIHTISFVNIWQWVGQSTVIYLAGMMLVDDSLYEASDIDGAGRWMKFKSITLPLLAPSLTINLITSTIGTLKIYDLPFTMTGGGPGHATESLSIAIYENSFTYNKMGYGTAISLVLFFFVLVVSIVQMYVLRKREDGVL